MLGLGEPPTLKLIPGTTKILIANLIIAINFIFYPYKHELSQQKYRVVEIQGCRTEIQKCRVFSV